MSLLRETAVRGVLILGMVGLGLAWEEWQKPKVGRTCTAGTGACQDDKTDLSCQNGEYTAVPCKGPRGCSKADGQVRCDVSGNLDGDKCTKSFEGTGSCTVDGKSMVTCSGGEFHATACLGPKGCEKDEERLSHCDNSLNIVGGACTGGFVCSTDHKDRLQCVGGHFAPEATCNGAKGCWNDDQRNAHCDTSTVPEGARCTGAAGGCSDDGSKMLECTDAGVFAVTRVCRGGACGPLGGGDVGCADLTIAEPGDICAGDYGACSVDHRRVLECKQGSFVVTETCTCEVGATSIGCAR